MLAFQWRRAFEGMGDGDLGAVVWGVASPSSASVSALQSPHLLGASTSASASANPSASAGSPLSPAQQHLPPPAAGSTTPPPPPATDKQLSRRRKLQQKRTVYVPVGGAAPPRGETLPSDMWAWRKYGQKPIKGSPYPRGYYKCSSCKGCAARKQVERCPTDPSLLVITYTSDHDHTWPANRNSLAGTTRPKPSFCSDLAAASDPPHKFSASTGSANASPAGFAAVSPPHPANLEAASRFDSHDEEELFLGINSLQESSSSWRRSFLDDEGGAADVDPCNLFCWSAGGLPTF